MLLNPKKYYERPLTKSDRALLRTVLLDAINADNASWHANIDDYSTWSPRAKKLYRIFMSVAAERPEEYK
jgi:hypothetical protein